MTSIADVKIPIPINLIEAALLGIILFSFAFVLLFRKSYILKNIPDQYAKKARKILEDEENELTDGGKCNAKPNHRNRKQTKEQAHTFLGKEKAQGTKSLSQIFIKAKLLFSLKYIYITTK